VSRPTSEDFDEAAPEHRGTGIASSHWPRILAPIGLGLGFLVLWTAIVRIRGIPLTSCPNRF
jgi:hypothetical protein